MKDDLGNRMKSYEEESGVNKKFDSNLPIVVRLDGKAFHTFTKGLNRPYDKRLSELMVKTTKFLVEETNSKIGYTQSDEITLIFYSDKPESEIYFSGRLSKIISILAAKCSVFFNKNLKDLIPEKSENSPVFDCRTFALPSKIEAVNALIWRQNDANSTSK